MKVQKNEIRAFESIFWQLLFLQITIFLYIYSKYKDKLFIISVFFRVWEPRSLRKEMKSTDQSFILVWNLQNVFAVMDR